MVFFGFKTLISAKLEIPIDYNIESLFFTFVD